MGQYVIIKDRYTRGQRLMLKRLDNMFGKVYNESSITNELRCIIPRELWNSQRKNSSIVIKANHLDMEIEIVFNQCNDYHKNYELSMIKYL